jgi:hypothetical protein
MKTLSLAVYPILAALLSLASPALAQVTGFSAGPGLAPSDQNQPGAATGDDQGEPYETRVTTFKKSPGFTQDREFVTTRFWRLDPGSMTVELWANGQLGGTNADPSGDSTSLFQLEFEVGLVPHIQLDIYSNWEVQDVNGHTGITNPGKTGLAAEIRYAIPDYYGQVFANPTLYFELTSQYYDSPRAEFRLLLGGEVFTPKLLAALNVIYEQDLIWSPQSQSFDIEFGGDLGVNYEIIPKIFRLGVEAKGGGDQHGTPTVYPVFLVGPSMLLTYPKNPSPIKLLFSFLFGTQPQDNKYNPTVILSTSW